MTDDLDDLRREKRKFVEQSVTVKFNDSAHNNVVRILKCSSQDISAGGLKLVSRTPLGLNQHVPLEIDLGSMWAVIEAEAEVKWCLEVDDMPTYYIGLKLIDIQESNLQVWKKFVEKL